MSYQVSVLYNSSKIIPAPFVGLTRDIQRSPDGTSRARGWKIVVKGKVVAFAGSPDHTGTFWTSTGYPPDPDPAQNSASLRMRNLRSKLGALSTLFDEDGHWFEIQPADGSAPLRFQPRIQSYEYAEGVWFDTVDFTVQMEADCVHFGAIVDPACPFDPEANPAEESWSLEPLDEVQQTFRLVHSVSSIAKTRFNVDGSGDVDAHGWELAKQAVDAALGYDADVVGSVFGLASHEAYNYTASRRLDQAKGEYSVTENWVVATQPYTEEATTEITYSTETGLYAGKVSGTITGLQDDPEDVASRYENAADRAAVVVTVASRLAYLEADAGFDFNPQAVSTVIARNRPNGVITYSVEFNTRPALPGGTIAYSSEISIDHAVPVVAEIGVIGRLAGPVPQAIGSYTQAVATVSMNAVVPVAYGQPAPTPPVLNPLTVFTAYVGTPPTVWVAADKENFSPETGRYSRTTSFKYQMA